MDNSVRAEDVLHLFDSYRKVKKGFMVSCPFHGTDSDPSLHIYDSDATGQHKLMVKCFGCDVPKSDILSFINSNGETVLDAQTLADIASGKKKSKEVKKERGTWKEAYTYRDDSGQLVFQTIRFENPKDFICRRPSTEEERDATGKDWVYSKEGINICLYNSDLIAKMRAKETQTYLWKCYAEDTEILTGEGWKFFKDLSDADKVAQYSRDGGEISFVTPLARQEFDYSGEMVDFSTDWCDLLVTPDHRMLTKYAAYTPKKLPLTKVKLAKDMWNNILIPTSGIYTNVNTTSPTIPQAKLLAAVAADGYFFDKNRYVRFNLKKERKVLRLKSILDELGITYSTYHFKNAEDWTSFYFSLSDHLWVTKYFPDKKIDPCVLNWNLEVRRAFLLELGHWDGDFVGSKGIRYYTGKKEEADLVTRLAAITGFGSVFRVDTHKENPSYVVNLTERSWRSIRTPKKKSYNGKVYCVTVDSGFVVVRRNGKVCVSGNCEGESKCNLLSSLKMPSTCNPFGATSGKFLPEFAEKLIGLNVVLVPDNDLTGYNHIYEVSELVKPHVNSLKIIILPRLEKLHDDIKDWFNLYGGTKDELFQLLDSAEELKGLTIEEIKYKYPYTFIDKVAVDQDLSILDSLLISSDSNYDEAQPSVYSPKLMELLQKGRETLDREGAFVGLCESCFNSGFILSINDDSNVAVVCQSIGTMSEDSEAESISLVECNHGQFAQDPNDFNF